MLAMILMVMTMMLTSMALVRETELGTMEQLLVTPLEPGQLIVGKLVPYALVGLVEILTALPIVLFWFRVPLRGSFADALPAHRCRSCSAPWASGCSSRPCRAPSSRR